jgi:hypothetical protein
MTDFGGILQGSGNFSGAPHIVTRSVPDYTDTQ